MLPKLNLPVGPLSPSLDPAHPPRQVNAANRPRPASAPSPSTSTDSMFFLGPSPLRSVQSSSDVTRAASTGPLDDPCPQSSGDAPKSNAAPNNGDAPAAPSPNRQAWISIVRDTPAGPSAKPSNKDGSAPRRPPSKPNHRRNPTPSPPRSMTPTVGPSTAWCGLRTIFCPIRPPSSVSDAETIVGDGESRAPRSPQAPQPPQPAPEVPQTAIDRFRQYCRGSDAPSTPRQFMMRRINRLRALCRRDKEGPEAPREGQPAQSDDGTGAAAQDDPQPPADIFEPREATRATLSERLRFLERLHIGYPPRRSFRVIRVTQVPPRPPPQPADPGGSGDASAAPSGGAPGGAPGGVPGGVPGGAPDAAQDAAPAA